MASEGQIRHERDLVVELVEGVEGEHLRCIDGGLGRGIWVQASSGKIYTGCNVENASYGGTICAERNAIAAAVVAGERQFVGLMVYTPQEQLTPPCGICRQVIAEFFTPDSPVRSCNHLEQQQEWTLEQLLPSAFTPLFLANSKKF